MDPTLIEILHKLYAWEPPDGLQRVIHHCPDSDPPGLLVGLVDGSHVDEVRLLTWRDEGGAAEVLGGLDATLAGLALGAQLKLAVAGAMGGAHGFSPN